MTDSDNQLIIKEADDDATNDTGTIKVDKTFITDGDENTTLTRSADGNGNYEYSFDDGVGNTATLKIAQILDDTVWS
jgi:hypothetical protein